MLPAEIINYFKDLNNNERAGYAIFEHNKNDDGDCRHVFNLHNLQPGNR
jgi:hypothetical protein